LYSFTGFPISHPANSHVVCPSDKIFHAGAYFIMGLLAWRNFKHLTDSPIILALLSFTFCSLFVSDEWHQSFVEGRFSDIAIDCRFKAPAWQYY
jgi:VanZ family protein